MRLGFRCEAPEFLLPVASSLFLLDLVGLRNHAPLALAYLLKLLLAQRENVKPDAKE